MGGTTQLPTPAGDVLSTDGQQLVAPLSYERFVIICFYLKAYNEKGSIFIIWYDLIRKKCREIARGTTRALVQRLTRSIAKFLLKEKD